jgi:Glycosyl transferase family 64 domain
MRRYASDNHPESSPCPTATPGASESGSPINTTTQWSPTLFTQRPRLKKLQKKKRTNGPLLVQKDGVITFRPAVIKGFVAVGISAFLGVHLFLLAQLSHSTTTTAGTAPPALFPSDARSSSQARISDSRQQTRMLTRLRPIDKEQYTIRINTWQRLEQLLISIDHHASCPGVAQIQVVWCEEEDPPDSLLRLHPEKVFVERHAVNSLNERFHILPTTATPTLGILSMDDDVLRSCEAIDSGFFQWIQSPARMVGFDYRVHVANDDGTWKVSWTDNPVVFAVVGTIAPESHPSIPL